MKRIFIYADTSSWHSFFIKPNDILKETDKAYFIATHNKEWDGRNGSGHGIWISKKLVRPSGDGYKVSVGNDFIIKPKAYNSFYKDVKDYVRGEMPNATIHDKDLGLTNGLNFVKFLNGEISHLQELTKQEQEMANAQEMAYKSKSPYHQKIAEKEAKEKEKAERAEHNLANMQNKILGEIIHKAESFKEQETKRINGFFMKKPSNDLKQEVLKLRDYLNDFLSVIERAKNNISKSKHKTEAGRLKFENEILDNIKKAENKYKSQLSVVLEKGKDLGYY